jgi:hypothetical protein
MEHLIINLKEKLLIRRKNEYDLIRKATEDNNRESLFMMAGKIQELDFIIDELGELINYNEKIKKIEK